MSAASDNALASEVPTAYLEIYPHPAFVYTSLLNWPGVGRSSREITWCNSKWATWSQGVKFDSLLSEEGFSAFEDWIGSDNGDVFVLEGAGSKDTLQLIKSVLASGSESLQRDALYVVTSLPLSQPKRFHRDGQGSLAPPTKIFSPSTPTPTSPYGREPENEPNDISLDDAVDQTINSVPRSPQTDCNILLETTDWGKTKLGPRKDWCPVIETMIEVVMRSPTQDSLWLGEEFQMIYNNNYADIVHHPRMYGASAMVKEAWGPVWHSVAGLIDGCLKHGHNVYREDDLLLYRKGPRGHWVEKYHTWSFIPLFSVDGEPLGLYNPTRETTAAVVARRRQETMRDLSEQLLIARKTSEFYGSIVEVLEKNPKDVPFLMCYSVEEETKGLQADLILESSLGVPEDHPSAPSKINVPLVHDRSMRASFGPKAAQLSSPTLSAISALSSSAGGRVGFSYEKGSWPLAKAIISRQAVVVDDCSQLIQGFPLREWEALPTSAIVIPICSETSSELPHGVLIMGLNVASPLEATYEDWIHVLRAHLTSSLGSVRAFEAEHQRQIERDRMERAKTAWFQGAAHDLRSPLTLVAGPLDDVLRTRLEPDQRTTLSLAQRNLARVQRLVNSLLDFSRIEAGKLTGRFAPIDLGRFVSDLAALFRPAMDRRKLAYKIEVEDHTGMVFVDPTLLETVITNLISNALKYTEKGSVQVHLSFEERHANIAVIDTGIGIPQSELSAVTDRFHRATTALSRGTEGTGIGLALAKEIVRLHGGELFIMSQTTEETGGPHGSTFMAQIPLVERQVVEDGFAPTVFGVYGKEVVAEAMHWVLDGDGETDSVGSTVDTSMNSRADGLLFERTDVLLLVDDNTDMRHYVKKIFSPYCKVIEAVNGKDGLAKAKKHRPHLILSDLMMPVMNGQELLTAIREDPTTKTIPMVLLSAATDDELRLGALVEGAEDFLLKPFKPKELLARIHLHMQIGKKRDHLESLYAARQQELAVLSDYCPSGIIRADADGTITYGNAMYHTYTGIPEGVDLNNWPDYVDSETLTRISAAWQEVLHGDARETTNTWKWLNGTTVSGTFIRLDKVDSGLTGVLGCLSDISYQEERLLDAERRRIEAEESKHQQELLVDLTSHEIRTPVSAILQCSSLVKENLVVLQEQLKQTGNTGFKTTPQLMSDLEEDIEALDSIYQCGLVQERIANDVLSLARVQLDMLTLHDFEMDLKAEAKKAKMKKIKLVLEFGENIDATGTNVLKTDHVRLHQVVTNLITNAIRFTANSATRIITVKYEISFTPPDFDTCAPPTNQNSAISLPIPENTPVWLFIAVRDTGPGLGPKEQAALFRRFSQGNKMIHTKYGGSGLGLFICKRISELLGGRIEMTSELGVGSVFRFFIQSTTGAPKVSQKALEESVSTLAINEPTETLSPTRSVVPASDSSALHLLVVEDNIINQTVLKRQIIKAGLTCDVANDGQEALDRIYKTAKPASQGATRPYDVILMDLEMPVMDGLTALKNIRESEANGSLDRQLVIALTGNARQGQIDQALAAGMDDVIIKPYKLNDLIAKLREKVKAQQTSTNGRQ